MDGDRANVRQLRDTPDQNGQPAWSPDGSKIAFVSNRDNPLASEIHVMNADGTEPVDVTNSREFDTKPAWSPDGSRIAFARRDASTTTAIHVMNADGTNQTQLTDGDHPAWSPQ